MVFFFVTNVHVSLLLSFSLSHTGGWARCYNDVFLPSLPTFASSMFTFAKAVFPSLFLLFFTKKYVCVREIDSQKGRSKNRDLSLNNFSNSFGQRSIKSLSYFLLKKRMHQNIIISNHQLLWPFIQFLPLPPASFVYQKNIYRANQTHIWCFSIFRGSVFPLHSNVFLHDCLLFSRRYFLFVKIEYSFDCSMLLRLLPLIILTQASGYAASISRKKEEGMFLLPFLLL